MTCCAECLTYVRSKNTICGCRLAKAAQTSFLGQFVKDMDWQLNYWQLQRNILLVDEWIQNDISSTKIRYIPQCVYLAIKFGWRCSGFSGEENFVGVIQYFFCWILPTQYQIFSSSILAAGSDLWNLYCRHMVAQGLSVKYLTPDVVVKYIGLNHLYGHA